MASTKVFITAKQYHVDNIVSSLLGKDVEVSKKRSGAPYIVGEDCHVSISHKKKYVVVGVSTKKVGVDIEKIEEKDTVFKIANKYFGERVENGNYDSFYRSWTKKEALGKIHEVGISHKLLSLNTEGSTYNEDNGDMVYFNHFYFEDYVVSVADYLNDVEFILDK